MNFYKYLQFYKNFIRRTSIKEKLKTYMEPQTQVLITSRGELTISGPIKSLPDLSFQDLNQPSLIKSEEGQKLQNFAKPSQDSIQHEFNVKFTKLLNDLFKQEKYSELFGPDIPKTIELNRYSDLLVCNV